jgi:hypothetical protein
METEFASDLEEVLGVEKPYPELVLAEEIPVALRRLATSISSCRSMNLLTNAFVRSVIVVVDTNFVSKLMRGEPDSAVSRDRRRAALAAAAAGPTAPL